MPQPLAPETDREWREILAPWYRRWGVPELERRLTLTVSSRLRTTLARCRPAPGEIRVASFLLEAPRPLVEEVLCHEAAHAAVMHLNRRGCTARVRGPPSPGPGGRATNEGEHIVQR